VTLRQNISTERQVFYKSTLEVLQKQRDWEHEPTALLKDLANSSTTSIKYLLIFVFVLNIMLIINFTLIHSYINIKVI
jgi:hypothetical protein